MMVASEAGTIVTWAMSWTVSKVMVVVMVMMMMPGVIPERIVPAPVVTVPVIGTIPVVIVIPIAVVRIIIRIVVSVAIGIESPVPGIAHIDVSVATVASSVVVIVIIHSGTGSCTKTLDAGCEVLIVISFGGGVHHAVGVGHCFCGLIHGIDVGLIVFAVRVIRLIVVGGVTADTGGGAAAASGVLSSGVIVRRVVGVVVGHLFVG